MQIIVTMAGLSSRFRDEGYRVPKYEISVRGKTLFGWSQSSLTRFAEAGARFVYVCQRGVDASSFIEREVGTLPIRSYGIVELDHPTDGQATSALMAGPAITNEEEPMLIYNIDTFVDPEFLDPAAMHGDGWIPCFEGEGDAWSFVRTDGGARAVEVREKERISPFATVGLYGFSSFRLFSNTYDRYFSVAREGKGERYVAPMYAQLIDDAARVFVTMIPEHAVHPLGTPAEVAAFADLSPA